MIKSCAKLDDGKMLIILGIVAKNVEQILAGNPLITNFGFAGTKYQTMCLAIHNNEEASIELVKATLAKSPIVGMCCVLGLGEGELEDLKTGLFKIDPGEVMPDIQAITIFYGETEGDIEKSFRKDGLITPTTKLLGQVPSQSEEGVIPRKFNPFVKEHLDEMGY